MFKNIVIALLVSISIPIFGIILDFNAGIQDNEKVIVVDEIDSVITYLENIEDYENSENITEINEEDNPFSNFTN